eukprot:4887685-Amphidinium_carterae.1
MDHHPVLYGGCNAATLEEQSLALHMILARCTSASTVQVAGVDHKVAARVRASWNFALLSMSSVYSSRSHSATCRYRIPRLEFLVEGVRSGGSKCWQKCAVGTSRHWSCARRQIGKRA